MEIIYQPKHNDSLDALDTCTYPSITIFLSADVSKAGTAHSTTYGYLLSGKAVFLQMDKIGTFKRAIILRSTAVFQ